MRPGMIDRWGHRRIEILLVEDNPGDARLTQELLKDCKFEVNVSVAEDGEVAMAHLLRQGPYADSPRPDLVLLDLMMPNKDGCAVLSEMSASRELRDIPVVVLTGTPAEEELLRFDNFDPSRYCTKPIDPERFHRILDHLTTTFQIPPNS